MEVHERLGTGRRGTEGDAAVTVPEIPGIQPGVPDAPKAFLTSTLSMMLTTPSALTSPVSFTVMPIVRAAVSPVADDVTVTNTR